MKVSIAESPELIYVVKTYYDVQKLRVACLNRTKVTEFIHCPACKITIPKPKPTGRRGRKWTGGCPRCGFENIDTITKEPPQILVKVGEDLKRLEEALYKMCYEAVSDDPIWINYLQHVKGIGPITAAALLVTLHPSRFRTISALWKYCNLHVEFRCPNCGKEYDKETICTCGTLVKGRAPRRRRGERTKGSPWARRLAWLIAFNIARQGGVYKALYHQFYEESRAKHPDWTDSHVLADARRRIAKLFLSHYLQAGRAILGLPVPLPYIVGKGLHQYIPPLKDYGDDPSKDEFYRMVLERILPEANIKKEWYDALIEDLKHAAKAKPPKQK